MTKKNEKKRHLIKQKNNKTKRKRREMSKTNLIGYLFNKHFHFPIFANE